MQQLRQVLIALNTLARHPDTSFQSQICESALLMKRGNQEELVLLRWRIRSVSIASLMLPGNERVRKVTHKAAGRTQREVGSGAICKTAPPCCCLSRSAAVVVYTAVSSSRRVLECKNVTEWKDQERIGGISSSMLTQSGSPYNGRSLRHFWCNVSIGRPPTKTRRRLHWRGHVRRAESSRSDSHVTTRADTREDTRNFTQKWSSPTCHQS